LILYIIFLKQVFIYIYQNQVTYCIPRETKKKIDVFKLMNIDLLMRRRCYLGGIFTLKLNTKTTNKEKIHEFNFKAAKNGVFWLQIQNVIWTRNILGDKNLRWIISPKDTNALRGSLKLQFWQNGCQYLTSCLQEEICNLWKH
jgi:hypothetical protein